MIPKEFKMIKGTSKLIKKINIYNIINILKNKPDISRAEIAKITKLTPASITKITKQLIDRGILIETGAGENSLGRPSILLNINKDAGYFIGFYLAPRKIISIFTNYVGETVSTLETKLLDLSHDNILDIIDIHIESFRRVNPNILGVGIALNGMVNSAKGVFIFSPHYSWKNYNIKSYLENKCSYTVFVENDVRLMALGELEHGAAIGENNFVLINIGDGIGAGIIIDKKVYNGNNFCAGEIGHIKVSTSSKRLCSCGKYDCLETFLSNENVIKISREKYSLHINSIKELSVEYLNKNPVAEEIVEDISEKLAFTLSPIINLLNQHTILINGEINDFGKNFYAKLSKKIIENSLESSLSKLKIKPAKLGDLSAAQGAISMVFNKLYN